jgi:pyrroline-5-carboxylate reductase
MTGRLAFLLSVGGNQRLHAVRLLQTYMEEDVMEKMRIAILGAGNLGTCIANGLADSGRFPPESISLTRRRTHLLDPMKARGFDVQEDNRKAVQNSSVIIIAVEPGQMGGLLAEINHCLVAGRHIIISTVAGASIAQIVGQVGRDIVVIRAMPNTAIGVRESMTCLASRGADDAAMEIAKDIFEAVGKTLVIDEEQMAAATALEACGVAFFLRAIRAASQGGIEIGFHPDDALAIAAQTAKGAALLLIMGNHPEHEIDRITTPRGCTIAGLNQMEHAGFSSAMIKGITVSAEKAAKLYSTGSEREVLR